eukprot:m.371978 g.371978  ORF g.371978 m.371978 type:complete len:166 (+) comp28138_c0_seq1:299-796(+)
MLREPISRVVSAYYFHDQYATRDPQSLGDWDTCLNKMYVDKTTVADLGTASSNPDSLCFEYADDQVKWLSGAFKLRTAAYKKHDGSFTFGPRGKPSGDDLAAAKHNLCRTDVVMLKEQLHRSVWMSAALFRLSLRETRGPRKAKPARAPSTVPRNDGAGAVRALL